MIEKYKTEGREISKKEMESIQTMESEMAVEKKKCMTYKMELAMLLPRKNKRTKKIKKLTWSEKTKKNEFIYTPWKITNCGSNRRNYLYSIILNCNATKIYGRN